MTPRVETHIRLGIRPVPLSDESPRCPHEETFGPYLLIGKCCAVSPRNLRVSVKFRGENPRRNK